MINFFAIFKRAPILPSIQMKCCTNFANLFDNESKNKLIRRLAELSPSEYLFKVPKGRRKFAVFVPLLYNDANEPAFLFTVRASHLNDHRGQVSFPGGAVEFGESILTAALRETNEEIGLKPENVDVWAEMLAFPTKDNSVTPVIGVIKRGFSTKINSAEVDEIFTDSVRNLCDPENFRYTRFRTRPDSVSTAHYCFPVFVCSKYHI